MSPVGNMPEFILRAYEDGKYTDLFVEYNGARYAAHRLIVCSQSTVFDRMCFDASDPSKPCSIDLSDGEDDVDDEHIRSLLRFLYKFEYCGFDRPEEDPKASEIGEMAYIVEDKPLGRSDSKSSLGSDIGLVRDSPCQSEGSGADDDAILRKGSPVKVTQVDGSIRKPPDFWNMWGAASKKVVADNKPEPPMPSNLEPLGAPAKCESTKGRFPPLPQGFSPLTYGKDVKKLNTDASKSETGPCVLDTNASASRQGLTAGSKTGMEQEAIEISSAGTAPATLKASSLAKHAEVTSTLDKSVTGQQMESSNSDTEGSDSPPNTPTIITPITSPDMFIQHVGFPLSAKFHAVMYSLAQKYKIQGLSTYSKSMYEHALQEDDPERGGLLDSISTVYKTTTALNRGLRDTAAMYAANRLDQIRDGDKLRALICEVPEFGADMIELFRTCL